MTQTLRLDSAQPEHIRQAAQLLADGQLVAIPTETVYGLAADTGNAGAVRAVFAAKQRPIGHPLIVHLADPERMNHWATSVPETAWRLAEAFWPGPLTLLLPKHERASELITGASDRIAVRMPRHPVALDVIRTLGREVVAPSANPYGRISPTTADHVLAGLSGKIAAVLDGGACTVGLESTIVDLSGERPTVVRPGLIGPDQLASVLGRPVTAAGAANIAAPGNVKRHYQPKTPTSSIAPERLSAEVQALIRAGARVGVLWYRSAPPEGVTTALQLSQQPGDYARMFYAALHSLDQASLSHIVIETPPVDDAWAALHDRLRRACAR